MEAKHFVLLFGLLVAVPIGIRLAVRDRRIMDACAFLLLFGTTRCDLQVINLVSREWYRGTTRGFEISWLDFLWMILLGAVIMTRRRGRRTATPPSLVGMLIFLAYNALNVAYSTPQLFGLFELSKMFRGLMVFVTMAYYVRSERELRVLVWALCGAVVYEFYSACYGRFVTHRPRVEGTLGHPNLLSMFNLIAVPILIAVACSDTHPRLRTACGVAGVVGAITVLFTVSRTGVTALAVELALLGLTCGSLKITAKKVAVALGILIVGGAVLAKTWHAIEARFEAAGYEKEYEGKVYQGRGVYLRLAYAIAEAEPWGCGLNNWSYWVSNRYGPVVEIYYASYKSVDQRPPKRLHLRARSHADGSGFAAPAHTLFGITLGETGWAGVIIFGLLWLRWLQMTGIFLWRRSRCFISRLGMGIFFGLLGAAAQSYTEWAFRQTAIFFLLNVLLGMAAAIYPARVLVGRPAADPRPGAQGLPVSPS